MATIDSDIQTEQVPSKTVRSLLPFQLLSNPTPEGSTSFADYVANRQASTSEDDEDENDGLTHPSFQGDVPTLD